MRQAQEAQEEAETVKSDTLDIVQDLPYKKKVAASLTAAKQDSVSAVTAVKQQCNKCLHIIFHKFNWIKHFHMVEIYFLLVGQVENLLPEIVSLEQNLRDRPSKMEKAGNDLKDKLEKLKQQVEKARELVNRY